MGRFCIHQVMTVHPAAMRTAAEHMAAENVGTLVVLECLKPVGILTDRDVVVRAIAQGYAPEATEVGIIALDDILELLAEDRQALDAVVGVMRSVRQEPL
jgi:CBS domain-containing protein